MNTTPINEAALTVAMPAIPSPSLKVFDFDFTGSNYEMDASISDEERRFYLKMYPTVDVVNQRKVHCTVCRTHIGTAPNTDSNIKMHPILRVTHCIKCHEFYNSGEFSKGEDGSELYCRWCGQGGEVYCCSTCPFVFCKSCIIKNLSRGVIVDIEQNENWNCFKCTSKILWPLRAQHWALVNYIETQKRGLQSLQLSELEVRRQMHKDKSTCCRLAKAKANSLSDSMESLESTASKRSHASSVNSVKKSPKPQGPPAKRPKSSNDEVVCTPDLLSMLEPDCQISVANLSAKKTVPRSPVLTANITTTPRIVTVQQNYGGPSPSSSISSSNGNSSALSRSSLPPPLVLSSSGMRYRQIAPTPASVVRRTVVPNAIRNAGPVFHTINGFRVDLNSAAQQDSYRLPNGRLIQVKRQVPPTGQPATTMAPAPLGMGPQVIIRQRPVPPPRMVHNSPGFGSNMGIYNPQTNQQQRAPQVVRVNNGSQVQSVNLTAPSTPVNSNGGTTIMMTPASVPKGNTLVRHVFPNSPIGTARTQLQEQIFNAMEICTHLTGKVQTLTHSNAYNQARSYMDLKELYIHLSYLMTYAIGRFKQLQDKCLVDMREMGFKNDANSLENGQLAAAVDYVCYGQLDDVDLFNTGCNSFHNQVYEYRKSLRANLKEGENIEPLPPLMPLGVRAEGDPEDEDDEQDVNDEVENENDEPDDYNDEPDDDADDGDDLDDDYDALGTEESMNRNEQAHAYDRKLTRLLREYPSIWCTRHPDYGKMDVTRKQWRVIASHFPRGDDIKLRWKNVRKRYVRIERLLKQGKRFKGYFDKATNYLANRDLSRNEWLSIDCGEDDGDGFERKQLDAIENTIHKGQQDFADIRQDQALVRDSPHLPVRPLDVCPIDMRIINFAKSHPVLWRKSADPEFNSIDEQTRKSLWLNFWKSATKKQASDDEDNEIEIVEPKTDTITIDSDNEEESPSTSAFNIPKGLKITSVKSTAETVDLAKVDPVTANIDPTTDIDVAAFSSSILASLLEVDFNEGSGEVKTKQPASTVGTIQKKQPRKKMTHKPNPALLQLERQRMEETKRNDAKLKMKVVVKLRRAEDDFEVARKWVEKHNRVPNKPDASKEITTKENIKNKAKVSESQVMINAENNAYESSTKPIQNKNTVTNKNDSEKSVTKVQEKLSDTEVLKETNTIDETITKATKGSEANTTTIDTEKQSIQQNMNIAEGIKIPAIIVTVADKTTYEEKNKTERKKTDNQHSGEKAIKVAETLATINPIENQNLGVVTEIIETGTIKTSTETGAGAVAATNKPKTASAEVVTKNNEITQVSKSGKADEPDCIASISKNTDSVTPVAKTSEDITTEVAAFAVNDNGGNDSATKTQCKETASTKANSPQPVCSTAQSNASSVVEVTTKSPASLACTMTSFQSSHPQSDSTIDAV